MTTHTPEAPAATPDGGKRPYIVVVHGGKGGLGKTTLAEHLAWKFGERGETLFVDADLNQDSARDLYDQYREEAPFELAVVDDPRHLADIHSVRHRYVVIDAPPSSALAQPALDVSDLVVIPIIPRVIDTRAVMKTIREYAGGNNYRVVLCRITNTMGASRVNAVRAALVGQGVPVLNTVVREYLGPHETARSTGYPVTHPSVAQSCTRERDRESALRAAADMNSFAEEILKVAGVAAA